MSLARVACLAAIAAVVAALAGCATPPVDRSVAAPSLAVPARPVISSLAIEPSIEDRLLAIDPLKVSESEVREVLAHGPTPRIVGIHGGIYPVHLLMESFARFVIGMGYPEAKVRHPGDGRLSHSPYEDSERIAGSIAWYYEHEAVRPLLVGHSQGGMQVVKVLHQLAGRFDGSLRVWNPVADRAEDRDVIVDPYTGALRSVVGLSVAYASAVGAGGATTLLPNQWSMAGRLHSIPDSVDEFTGFVIGVDLVALDFGLGEASRYRPNGAAAVRNVRLPASYSHVMVPRSSHLARDPAMRDWINAWAPDRDMPPVPEGDSDNVLWAADVWYSIKKHWVLEAQRVVRARRAMLAQDGKR